MIKKRHKADRKFQRTKDPRYRKEANKAYAEFEELVKRASNADREKNLKRFERSRKVDLFQFFKMYEKMTNDKGASAVKGVQALRVDGSEEVVVDDDGKAKLIAEKLALSFKAQTEVAQDADIAQHHRETEVFVKDHPEKFQPLDGVPITKKITMKELKKAIKRLKLKAPGYDNISNLLLKRGGPTLRKHLLSLYNASLSCGYVPKCWKIAIIVPLPRPGKDLSKPGGYRPVSLLPTMAKLLELILATRIRDQLERFKLLPRHQSGFRRLRSTVDQAFRLAQMGTMARMRGDACLAVLLDFEGAFNAVWHNGLRKMLDECGKLDDWLVRWLSSFLTERVFRVRVGGAFSSVQPIEAGVPQGSALSPILFAFFTRNIIKDKKSALDVEVASYADDVLLISVATFLGHAEAKAQRALRQVFEWSIRWKLPLNPAKCQVLVVGGSCQKPRLYVGNRLLECVESTTYLGVCFDRKMNFIEHVTNVVERVTVRLHGLRRLCRSKTVSTASRKLIYTATIRPVIEYGCAALMGISNTQLERLEVLQNEAIRAIFSLPFDDQTPTDELCRMADLPTIEQRFRKLSVDFANRALSAVPPVGSII
ncbi:MAG TPA: reverse transcriptase family protein, partial [Fimbriimonas sp.]|nr:reverse transcriptase family protein [Fimbriimonas sp.]